MAKASLSKTVKTLSHLSPRFVSVTHGADGGAQNQTIKALDTLRIENPTLGLAGHLTCRAGSKGETIAAAQDYEATGARWVVALRGDAEGGAGEAFEPIAHGFQSTPDLIAGLREKTGLRIAVGAYPEVHPDSPSEAADTEHLKRKVDAGADTIITQYFFENDDFYRFVDRCRAAGIDVPIIPGIMPITNFGKIAQFSERCGAKIPARLVDRFEKAEARGVSRDLALAVCAGQCDDLREQGVRAFHFYTLNRADLTLGVCQALGVDP
ncbi:UNVERIFIED_CONTAM: hypothetical protein GTU68_020971, partial [Idotea baltica]|nr:hypothetical protein [Idotea baltica]